MTKYIIDLLVEQLNQKIHDQDITTYNNRLVVNGWAFAKVSSDGIIIPRGENEEMIYYSDPDFLSLATDHLCARINQLLMHQRGLYF